jgi:ubiquinone/menaquinone biosynthesis C-methylase UbiE
MPSDVRRFVPGQVDYDSQSATYAAGRGLSPEAEAAWREALVRYVDPARANVILDLGSGTGRFSPLLADALNARVVGIEPSRGMREAAVCGAQHQRVDYVGGDGRWIPLADGSCDAAWVFNVIHHVPDIPACARELARVVRAQGKVLVTGGWPGRCDDLTMFRYFPEGLQVINQFPTIEQVVAAFEPARFRYEGLERVTRQSCAGLKELAERVATRADTTLVLISDAAFQRGLAAIRRAAAAETDPQPVIDSLDMLIFSRG